MSAKDILSLPIQDLRTPQPHGVSVVYSLAPQLRPVSSIYSSTVASPISAGPQPDASTDNSRSTTSEASHTSSAAQRYLVLAQRLDELLDQLAFLHARQAALKQQHCDMTTRRSELAREAFLLDPVHGSFAHASAEVSGDRELGRRCQDSTRQQQLDAVRSKQEEKARTQEHIDELETRMARNQTKVDEGLELLWFILQERVRLGLEEHHPTDLGDMGDSRVKEANDGEEKNTNAAIERILALLSTCTHDELKRLQHELNDMLVPALRCRGTVMAQPLPTRASILKCGGVPWI